MDEKETQKDKQGEHFRQRQTVMRRALCWDIYWLVSNNWMPANIMMRPERGPDWAWRSRLEVQQVNDSEKLWFYFQFDGGQLMFLNRTMAWPHLPYKKATLKRNNMSHERMLVGKFIQEIFVVLWVLDSSLIWTRIGGEVRWSGER